MKSELPTHLEETSELLRSSLGHHPSDKAPEIPGELLDDLGSRFSTAQAAPLRRDSTSIFATIQQFISRPAFGMAAAAVVVLALVSPALINSTKSGTFRGGVITQETVDSAKIILVGAPDATADFLEKSGDFEKDSFTTQSDSPANSGSSKIIVDFNSSTIYAVDAAGTQLFTKPLPTDDPAIAEAIAKALSEL